MPRLSIPLEDRLISRLVEDADGCWIFQGIPASKWHGKLKAGPGRKSVYAHRAAFELWRGPIPDGMFVCHSCDVPKCCRPSHLFLGTQADNLRDRNNKGRGNAPRGADHPAYKHGKYMKGTKI